MNNRPDDPLGVQAHQDACYGQTALIVLGGPSGHAWQKVRDQVHPDVIIGANGTCYQIDDLDYWLLAFPLDILAVAPRDTLNLLERAVKSEKPITEWKARMLGKMFDADLFTQTLQSYLCKN